MPTSTSVIIFGAVTLIVLALFYAFSSGSVEIAERLGRLWRPPSKEGTAKESRKKLVESLFAGVTKFLPSSASERGENVDERMVRAGFRRPEAAALFRLGRVGFIVFLVALVYITGIYKFNPLLMFVGALVGGFMAPDLWLGRRATQRQLLLRLALPDALDLLVICMEAGLGLDQALMYVGQELRIAHPDLCAELDLVNAEMHVGKTRIDAFRSLATRTGVDDLQALVATLIQTDRFGTSVARSLRIHSDDLRMKRRQRAEEMAAKTTVKMLIPLVFFIFPALFVVILGPAVLSMLRIMGQFH